MKLIEGMFWRTGDVIRLCGCGVAGWPVSPPLPVMSDGHNEWATCPTCKTTWDLRTLKKIDLPVKPTKP